MKRHLPIILTLAVALVFGFSVLGQTRIDDTGDGGPRIEEPAAGAGFTSAADLTQQQIQRPYNMVSGAFGFILASGSPEAVKLWFEAMAYLNEAKGAFHKGDFPLANRYCDGARDSLAKAFEAAMVPRQR